MKLKVADNAASTSSSLAPQAVDPLQQYEVGPVPLPAQNHRLVPSASGLRSRRHAGGRHAARSSFEADRPLAPRSAHAALAEDPADPRARKPEAGLLPVDGVPDRPHRCQQHHQPRRRAARARGAGSDEGMDCCSRWSRRSPTPAWATAASAGWRPASSTRWPRLQIPAIGYGLRYEYGMFRQAIATATRSSSPTTGCADPIPGRSRGRDESRVRCTLGCSIRAERGGTSQSTATSRRCCSAFPTTGRSSATAARRINTLRLWAAASPDAFDFGEFSSGDFVGAVLDKVDAEIAHARPLSRRLDRGGPALRFVQEYFLVGCSLADIVAPLPPTRQRLARAARQGRHPAQRHAPGDGRRRADAHPARPGAAGLGRGLGPHRAHARLHQPHAAARGAGEMAGATCSSCCCRASWRSSTRSTAASSTTCARRYPGDDDRVRAHEPDRGRRRAQAGAHGAPGGRRHAQHQRRRRDPLRAAAHARVVRDFAEMFPERFNNKTNGVTPRRWLLLANPELAELITEAIGDGWITDLDAAAPPAAAGRRRGLPRARSARPSARPRRASPTGCKRRTARVVDPDTIFDCQIKRIHEYKRQLLNVLHIVVLYNRLRDEPEARRAAARRSSSPARPRPATTSPS